MSSPFLLARVMLMASLTSPKGIAIDAAGNIYVSDTYKYNIQKLYRRRSVCYQMGHCWGLMTGSLVWPNGLAVDAFGNIYVADSANNRIQKFTGSGTFITKLSSAGNADGMFYYPRGIAIDATGNVFVSDNENHRIQKFTADGQFLDKWGKVDATGNPLPGAGNREFNYPRGIAIDRDGNVYVADSGNYRIQKFTADGQYLGKWGIVDADGKFDYPLDVAVDSSNNVYVADSKHIHKFTSDGQLIPPVWGEGDGKFIETNRIAIDGNDNVYIADRSQVRHCIYRPEQNDIYCYYYYRIREIYLGWYFCNSVRRH